MSVAAHRPPMNYPEPRTKLMFGFGAASLSSNPSQTPAESKICFGIGSNVSSSGGQTRPSGVNHTVSAASLFGCKIAGVCSSDESPLPMGSTGALSSLLQKSQAPSRSCLLEVSLKALQCDKSPPCLRANAASSIANMALQSDIQNKMLVPSNLDSLVHILKCSEESTVRQFLCMAFGRLVSNKTSLPVLLAHDSLVQTLQDIAKDSNLGYWRQAARTVAIMTAKASDQNQLSNMCTAGNIGILQKLMQIEQTEIQTDAIRALVPYVQNADRIALLNDNNIWESLFRMAHQSHSPVIEQLTVNILQTAMESKSNGIRFSYHALELLSDLAKAQRVKWETAGVCGARNRSFSVVLCQYLCADHGEVHEYDHLVASGVSREVVSDVLEMSNVAEFEDEANVADSGKRKRHRQETITAFARLCTVRKRSRSIVD
ncbi:hypothetical protein GUITHDRAFT_133662 [Guillardia theta CCMP2712]|uniref:Condensin complex subunit 1 C-terminal domain-containing protein n=3 Tax=Guillardia theta TaxID=55529 RepID=L1JWX8_GUITC|nr:hypothetical protein GUITHDRAFT_133662 [Guillardia theta CCMP2712]EKX52613.1 hypothetical protein GUITHDRAFT_133662 [Guillardia theta CCMP2712]|eukprot:XP_005839593.1 hypothetical protein GUITHDRAFT_133662 [Guillardia theta CCMP2712]